jgi:hypothetical protein
MGIADYMVTKYTKRRRPTASQQKTVALSRWLSVCLMISCLTLLTSMNFFLYPNTKNVTAASSLTNSDSKNSDSNGYPPSGPTEEKSGNSGFSFSEEILHEAHPEFIFSFKTDFYLHHIADSKEIKPFYPERILPPPKV